MMTLSVYRVENMIRYRNIFLYFLIIFINIHIFLFFFKKPKTILPRHEKETKDKLRGVWGTGSKSTEMRARREKKEQKLAVSTCYSLASMWKRQQDLQISIKDTSFNKDTSSNQDVSVSIPSMRAMVPRASSPPLIPKTPIEIKKDREIASAKLDKLLKLPTVQKTEYGAVLDPCNSFHLRHRMVQSFLWIIQKRDQFPGTTERQLAYMVARSFNRGNHTSKKIIQWTNSWVNKGIIPKTQSGQHKHNFSWMDDEDVELAVREFICQQGESK